MRKNSLLGEVCVFALCAFLCLYGIPLPQVAMPGGQTEPVQSTPAPAPAQITVRVYDHEAQQVVPMDMETYLVGVLGAEMPASYQPEALRAQAVAARTYTYEKMLSGGCSRGNADICTDSGHCQAYRSLESAAAGWGDRQQLYAQKLRDAVYDTAGEILLYDGEPILALFHSTSGGQTEDVENVYSQALPYLRSVESFGEEDAPKYRATASFSKKEFAAMIKKANAKAVISADTVQNKIGVPVRYPSGRVESIQIGGVYFTGTQIRSIFSLNSANFTVQVQKDNVVFTTIGYGHGVGMSQVGANAMAQQGATYRDILLHYYTNVEISSIKCD